jgi:hypothetical protein
MGTFSAGIIIMLTPAPVCVASGRFRLLRVSGSPAPWTAPTKRIVAELRLVAATAGHAAQRSHGRCRGVGAVTRCLEA